MNRLAILLALLACSPAWAAELGAGGLTCSNTIPASVTIDSGSNRKFVFLSLEEIQGTPVQDIATVGGQAETESFHFEAVFAASDDDDYTAWIWNESAIGSMSGSTVVGTDDNPGDDNGLFIWGTVVNADQGNLGDYDGTNSLASATQIDVASVSSAGALILAAATKGTNANGTFTTWDTLTERCDTTIEFARDFGAATGDGGDSPTTVVHDASAGELSAVSLVFANAASSAKADPFCGPFCGPVGE